jgi:hypothetical protein
MAMATCQRSHGQASSLWHLSEKRRNLLLRNSMKPRAPMTPRHEGQGRSPATIQAAAAKAHLAANASEMHLPQALQALNSASSYIAFCACINQRLKSQESVIIHENVES